MNTVIFVLYVMTTVAVTGNTNYQNQIKDWRPIGEFHHFHTAKPALELCEEAAKSLGLDRDRYRCVRSK